MKRRNLLQLLTAAPVGTLLVAQQPPVPPKPTPAALEEIPIIEATIPDTAGSTIASFFSEVQFQTLRRLSDLILPAMDDVPGALATQAPEFLDFLVGASVEERKQLYREGLDELNRRAEKSFHLPFGKTTQTQAHTILAPLRAQWTAAPDKFTSFLQTAKVDILQATQSSEEWIRIVSKRVRSARGLGTYWFPIE
jgi:hypothetical protein